MKKLVSRFSKKKHKNEIDPRVSCICQYCGNRKYMNQKEPTIKEIDIWLKEFKCNKCHKRRNFKTQN